MYIYGGALVENEDITNELWQFDFVTLSWQQLNRQQFDNGSNNMSTSDVSKGLILLCALCGCGHLMIHWKWK